MFNITWPPIPSRKVTLALSITAIAAALLACSLPKTTPTAFSQPANTLTPPAAATQPAASMPVATPSPLHIPPTPNLTPSPTPHTNFNVGKLSSVEKNIVYCAVDEVLLFLDIYYPAMANRSWPVVILLHGGGWSSGDKAGGIAQSYAEPLQQAGFLVAAVNYRLSPEFIFPAHLEDAKCAVRYLRAHAADYNLDADHIGVLGFSAGGHLAALLGTTDRSAGFDDTGSYLSRSSRVQAVVDISGPTNLRLFCDPGIVARVFGASSCNDRDTLFPTDPASYISADDPPFLIIHGSRDRAVAIEHSYALKESLDEGGVPATLLVVQNAGHSYTPLSEPMEPSLEQVTQIIIQFFTDTLF
ncbi:MAG: alpha/beta hydrolase [Anaerolineae bacterium]|nr:alpha/beta hydrolase [Anaerolineae bacterium]